jgi:peptidoglycan/LPS O-acetylase OafA/YrhL
MGNIFMLQDYPGFLFLPDFSISSFGSARPFWTLAIEWWIYLSFGYLILVFLKKDKLSLLNILILLFFSVVPVFNLIIGRGNGLTTCGIYLQKKLSI